MALQSEIEAVVRSHADVLENLPILYNELDVVVQLVAASLASGGRILFCGNGGSASDAQHLAAEFAGRFVADRRAFDALALSANVATLTAVGNDYGYERVFSRQVEAYGRAGDVLIGLTTSGNSPNVLEAAREARSRGLAVVGMTGSHGGEMAAICDHCLKVPSTVTARIQEMHILLGHILCQLVEHVLA